MFYYYWLIHVLSSKECVCCVCDPSMCLGVPYNGMVIVVMSGEVICCSVVCGTLVGVSVFSIMCSELLIMSRIS